jgi:NapC/NirT cytochrome c family protein
MRARNLLSFAGAALTTVGAVLFLVFFALDLVGFHTNPYFGIVTFVILPALFVTGLLLIPLGIWRTRRRIARGMRAREWPVLNFARASVRWTAIVIIALTGINIAIVSMAAYKAVEYSDSTGFCTGVCHTPMEPQAIAHSNAVHASVSCASCHVGPGASGFVSAKMGGVRRLRAVVTGHVSRPIPVPVRDLPETAGTCLECHRRDRYVGDRVKQIREYADDETATEQVTTLTMKVGGGGFERGGPHGIHWHASPQTQIEYVASEENRDTILWLRVTDARGPREYTADGVTREQMAAGVRRTMDCTDCHNRAGHTMIATPERSVNTAIDQGLLPRGLPFIRREAVAALKQEFNDRGAAEQQIETRLRGFYGTTPGVDPLRLTQAVDAVRRIYATNVFPTMHVKWGTYPNHLGHVDSNGCFRCHDELHKTAAGKAITQDCEICHGM